MTRNSKIILIETILIIFLFFTNIFSYLRNDLFKETVRKIFLLLKNFIHEIIKIAKSTSKWIISQEYDFSLNNREIALLMLIFILILYSIKEKKVRDSFKGVLRVLTTKTAIKIFTQITIYLTIILVILYQVKLWDTILLKDTIIWSVFTATFLVYKSIENNKNKDVYKNIIIGTLTLTTIFQFFQNLFFFPIIVEFILMFVVSSASLMIAVIENKEEDKNERLLRNILEGVTIIVGSIYLINTIINIIIHYDGIINFSNLKAFMLPILLNFLYIPFIIYVVVFSIYEEILLSFKFNKKISTFRKLVLHFHVIKKTRLRRFDLIDFIQTNKVKLYYVDSAKDVNELIKTI